MNKLNHYQFTLILSGVNEDTIGIEDSLFESGCDDALINFRNGAVYLDFDREATTFEKAVISAINDVERADTAIRVVSVAPDDYVTESEIAKRLHVTRQTVSQWVTRARRANQSFPVPSMKLTEKSPLWRWAEVARWLFKHDKLDNPKLVDEAQFIETINLALLERIPSTHQYCHQLIKKLSVRNVTRL